MRPSFAVWLLTAALATFALFQDRPWKQLQIFDWDGGGYYVPLPAAFIYHDLGRADSLETIHAAYRPPGHALSLGLVHLPNGKIISKYPLGVAITDIPWFWGSHLYAGGHGYPRDGYSRPYQQAFVLAGLCYALLGLWLVRKLLCHFYEDKVAAWALAGIGLGTNFFCYATYEAQMAHSHLIMWQAALLWCTVRWYETLETRFAAGIGLFLGLAVLTRPTEALYALVPLCWGLTSLKLLEPRLQLWARQWRQLVLAAVLAGAVVSIQLMYWRYISGHWLLYSYGKERFTFDNPHLLDGLFSFRKGWLLYSPMAGLALLGLFWLRRYVAAALPVLLVLVPVVLYVTFSWEQWWYGGGFGARPLISLYPLLALALAALIARAFGHRRMVGLAALMLVFMALNLWQTWQYAGGLLPSSDNTRELYLRNFFRTSFK